VEQHSSCNKQLCRCRDLPKTNTGQYAACIASCIHASRRSRPKQKTLVHRGTFHVRGLPAIHFYFARMRGLLTTAVLSILCFAAAASTAPSLQLPQHREVVTQTGHLKQRLPLPIPAATDVAIPIEAVVKPAQTLGGRISPALQARLKVCFSCTVTRILLELPNYVLFFLPRYFFADRLASTSCSGTP
jgi:hypothetical protein